MVAEALKNIEINGQTYLLSAITGKVIDCQKRNETIVSGRGGGGFIRDGSGFVKPVSIHSQTKVYDQIFIIDELGQEHSFELCNFNLACRSNSKLSIVKVQKIKFDNGIILIVYNHDTRQIFFNEYKLYDWYKVSWLWHIPVFCLGWILSGIVSMILSFLSDSSLLSSLSLLIIFITPFLFERWREKVCYNRIKAFKSRDKLKRLIDYLVVS